jgi:hypothetical protein
VRRLPRSASLCFSHPKEPLCDDLPRLFDQCVNNLAGWRDLADQANALTR